MTRFWPLRRWRPFLVVVITAGLALGATVWWAHRQLQLARAAQQAQEAVLRSIDGERVYILEQTGSTPISVYFPEFLAECWASFDLPAPEFETFESLTVLMDGDDASVANLKKLRGVPLLTRLILTGVTLTDAHRETFRELPACCPQLQPVEVYDSLTTPAASAALASLPTFNGAWGAEALFAAETLVPADATDEVQELPER
jgi:hypothetical protein